MKNKPQFSLKDTPESRAIIEEAQGDIIKIFENATISAVADSAATNKAIAQYLMDTRMLVEDESIKVIDAMRMAFSEKSERLKTLKSVADEVASQSAFMGRSLNSINTKKAEIDAFLVSLARLNGELDRFEQFAKSGLLEKMHSIAEVMR